MDCATSIYQRGKIEYYARIGKDTPASAIITHDGSELTNSEKILEYLKSGKAALAPLGGSGEATAGYKGYGYATVVEILSSALAGNMFLKDLTNTDLEGNKRPYHLGHFFMVINPEFFMGTDQLRKTAGDILRALRNSETAPGAERIYTAGEKEYEVWLERKDKGVPISKAVQKEILEINERYNLGYTFEEFE